MICNFSKFRGLDVVRTGNKVGIVTRVTTVVLVRAVRSIFQRRVTGYSGHVVVLITRFFNFFYNGDSPTQCSVFFVDLTGECNFHFFRRPLAKESRYDRRLVPQGEFCFPRRGESPGNF